MSDSVRGAKQDTFDAVKIKHAIRVRDGMRCTQCGMTNDEHREKYGSILQVHRVTPASLYTVEPGACVTLCIPCHGPKPRSKRGANPHKRPRITFSVPPSVRMALTIVAAERDITLSQLVEEMARANIPEQIERATSIAHCKPS